MHISMNRGDFIYAAWENHAQAEYDKKISELKEDGYELVDTTHDFLNEYQTYKKGNKEIVVTILCC